MFSFGINILLNQFSRAQIVAGSIPDTFLSFQSSANSHKNILHSINFFSMITSSDNRIQIAIGKSKLGPTFLMSAGARFTVILVVGSLARLDFKALLTLSLLSWIH
jgi:hypothetical protein